MSLCGGAEARPARRGLCGGVGTAEFLRILLRELTLLGGEGFGRAPSPPAPLSGERRDRWEGDAPAERRF
jgi:hypothetical protein